MDALGKLAAKKHLAEMVTYSLTGGFDKEAAWTMDTILSGTKKAVTSLKRGAKKAVTKTKRYGDVLVGGPQKRLRTRYNKGKFVKGPVQRSRRANLVKAEKRTRKTRIATGAGLAGVAGIAALVRAASKRGGKGMSKGKLMSLMKQHKGKLVAGGAAAAAGGGLAALASRKKS
jgi:hypothetical protein